MSLVRLIWYAEAHPIAKPFYGTKLGSQMSFSCHQLFNKVHSTFEVEFEAMKKEEEFLTHRENISWEVWSFFKQFEKAGPKNTCGANNTITNGGRTKPVL